MENFENAMNKFCQSVHEQQTLLQSQSRSSQTAQKTCTSQRADPCYSQLTLSKVIRENSDQLTTTQLIERKRFLQQQIDNLKRDVAAAQVYSDLAKSSLLEQSQKLPEDFKTPLQYSKYPEDEKQLLVELLARYEPEKLAAYNRCAKLAKSEVQFIRDTDDIAQKISIFTDNPEETAETYAFLDATSQKTAVKMTVEEAQQRQLAADNFSLKKRLATYKCYYRESINEMMQIKEKIDVLQQQTEKYEGAAGKIQARIVKMGEILYNCDE